MLIIRVPEDKILDRNHENKSSTHIVFGTEIPYAFQVTFIRDFYSSFTLNRFHHECTSIRVADSFLQNTSNEGWLILT